MIASVPLQSAPAVALHARDILGRLVDTGVARTSRVIERVMSETPNDSLVAADALRVRVPAPRVEVVAGDNTWGLHRNALDQFATRVGVPIGYVRSLLESDDADDKGRWRQSLLEDVLTQHVKHTEGRFLIRSVSGEAKAVLSDRYRRLDSRPLLDAFIGACASVGAVPYEGVASELSASVRAIVPKVFEPVPGEALVFGLSWSNSDFGTRAYALSAFVLRLVCLNGMVGSNRLKQVHLGGRLPEHLEFSEQTHRLDTETMVSATRDVVSASLGSAAIAKQLQEVRAAHDTEIDWSSAWRRVSRELTKQEQKAVRDSFDGPDVLHLPAGRTTWRLSNAVSWLANGVSDPERKLDLQRLAGAVLPQAA